MSSFFQLLILAETWLSSASLSLSLMVTFFSHSPYFSGSDGKDGILFPPLPPLYSSKSCRVLQLTVKLFWVNHKGIGDFQKEEWHGVTCFTGSLQLQCWEQTGGMKEQQENNETLARTPVRDAVTGVVAVEAVKRGQILDLLWRLVHQDLLTNCMKCMTRYMKCERKTKVEDHSSFLICATEKKMELPSLSLRRLRWNRFDGKTFRALVWHILRLSCLLDF